VSPSMYEPSHENVFDEACFQGRVEIVRFFIDLDIMTNLDRPSLSLSLPIIRGHVDTARVVLEEIERILTDDLEYFNIESRSIERAVEQGHEEIVQLFLDRGAVLDSFFPGV